MFVERTNQKRRIRTTAPESRVSVIERRPRPRVSVVEPEPSARPSLLNTALNTASQLVNLVSVREKVRLEQARAAAIKAEVAALLPTPQPSRDLATRRQEIPWTFILLGGGALMLILSLIKKK